MLRTTECNVFALHNAPHIFNWGQSGLQACQSSTCILLLLSHTGGSPAEWFGFQGQSRKTQNAHDFHESKGVIHFCRIWPIC